MQAFFLSHLNSLVKKSRSSFTKTPEIYSQIECPPCSGVLMSSSGKEVAPGVRSLMASASFHPLV